MPIKNFDILRSVLANTIVFIFFIFSFCFSSRAETSGQTMEERTPASVEITEKEKAAIAKEFVQNVFNAFSRNEKYDPVLKGFSENAKIIYSEEPMSIRLVFEKDLKEQTKGKSLEQLAADDGCYIYLRIQSAETGNIGGATGLRSIDGSNMLYGPNVKYYKGIGLRIYLDILVKNIIKRNSYSDLVMKQSASIVRADKMLSSEIETFSEEIVNAIYEDIAKLETSYPALKGFRENANIYMDKKNHSFGFSFEKRIKPASKRHPTGVLIDADSCFIRFRIGSYLGLEGGQTNSNNLPAFFQNLYMQSNRDVNVASEELKQKINDIISSSLNPLIELNNSVNMDF
jgi:hypothetical protein